MIFGGIFPFRFILNQIGRAFSANRHCNYKERCWLGIGKLLRTISIGSCVSIQGLLVAQMADGKIMVKVDEKTFVGYPVLPVRNS